MPETPSTNRGGRPKTGSKFPRQFTVYETDNGLDLLQRIADRWECSQADAVRRMIRSTARELGVDGPPMGVFPQTGSYRHATTLLRQEPLAPQAGEDEPAAGEPGDEKLPHVG